MSIDVSQLEQLNLPDLSKTFGSGSRPVKSVMTIFGTRPEAIKMAPVIRQLRAYNSLFRTVNVVSAQHTDLLYPLISLFDIEVDYDLQTMTHDQTPNQVCSRVLLALDGILAHERPELVLVQGDTTTAMAGAMAAFHHAIPVGHIEAGLRSHSIHSPYPEEMNRRLITSLATYHFAATRGNRETLRREGVAGEAIFVTGNTVVDSLTAILKQASPSAALEASLDATEGLRRVVLTTHRRESLGQVMTGNLRAIRRFVEAHEDVALLFPVHPNPEVGSSARAIFAGHPRIHLIEPLGYEDFIVLLSRAWLIVSDSGGVQEEAPTLGKPLLVLRENTERPEVIESGIARLVGGSPEQLSLMLEEAHGEGSWVERVKSIENPFGRGDSATLIARIVGELLIERATAAAQPLS
ncbi:MAG: UDP-N-acetylglucosamine 2-epimerase (non-hydrolyzing) [Pyrinomonadaceae bacterium]